MAFFQKKFIILVFLSISFHANGIFKEAPDKSKRSSMERSEKSKKQSSELVKGSSSSKMLKLRHQNHDHHLGSKETPSRTIQPSRQIIMPEGSVRDYFIHHPCNSKEKMRIDYAESFSRATDICKLMLGNDHVDEHETLVLSHDQCQFCIVGAGFENRAQNTAAMLMMAVRVIERMNVQLPAFRRLLFNIGDSTCNKRFHLAYAVTNNSTCPHSIRAVPDYTFISW